MDSIVTVGIPVGPDAQACRWLREALQSVAAQTVRPEVLLVDDMHDLGMRGCNLGENPGVNVRMWRAPWRMGVAHAFNLCVALAETPLVLMMGADDMLASDAVERAIATYQQTDPFVRDSTYYALPLRYMDTGEIQNQPCNAAVVPRALWQKTGGFPVESASGAPDAAFLSMIWNSQEFRIQLVDCDHPLYHYRRHDGTDTAKRGPWQGVILETRNLVTELFERPNWGRYEP